MTVRVTNLGHLLLAFSVAALKPRLSFCLPCAHHLQGSIRTASQAPPGVSRLNPKPKANASLSSKLLSGLVSDTSFI